MKKSRLVGFLLLVALNMLVTIYLRNFRTIAVLPRYYIGLLFGFVSDGSES